MNSVSICVDVWPVELVVSEKLDVGFSLLGWESVSFPMTVAPFIGSKLSSCALTLSLYWTNILPMDEAEKLMSDLLNVVFMKYCLLSWYSRPLCRRRGTRLSQSPTPCCYRCPTTEILRSRYR